MTKDQSIDHHLRATWQAIAKMYNDQAAKYDSTMAMAFVLLNIDMEDGTPLHSDWPSDSEWKLPVYDMKKYGR